jgi:hypothetical protein
MATKNQYGFSEACTRKKVTFPLIGDVGSWGFVEFCRSKKIGTNRTADLVHVDASLADFDRLSSYWNFHEHPQICVSILPAIYDLVRCLIARGFSGEDTVALSQWPKFDDTRHTMSRICHG